MRSGRLATPRHRAARPIATLLGWVAAVGSLATCSTPATNSARPDPSLPATPAGQALGAWLRIHNLGNLDSSRAFAGRSYSERELADRPAEVVARGHRLWLMNYGQIRIVRVDSSTPYSIQATVHESLPDALGSVFVDVDSAPPH